MATGLAIDVAGRRLSTWPAPAGVTGLTVDLLTDTMYVVDGTTVLPQFAGSPVAAVWKSKRIVLNAFPPFGWLRLEGPVTSAVVRIYTDGALWYTTPAITHNEPVRLPPGRHREIELEIESSGPVTEIVLATTADELRAL